MNNVKVFNLRLLAVVIMVALVQLSTQKYLKGDYNQNPMGSSFFKNFFPASDETIKLKATIFLEMQPVNEFQNGPEVKPVPEIKPSEKSGALQFTSDCGTRRGGIIQARSNILRLNATAINSDPSDNGSGKIVFGEPAMYGDWPWQASIRVRGFHMCGGSLIAHKYVVTASHCGFGKRFPTSDMTVSFGTLSAKYKSPYEQTRNVVRVTQNEGFDMSVSMNNDVTVLELDSPVQYNQYVSPICLPTKPLNIDSLCFASGYGLTQNTGVSDILNSVMLPIVSNQQCSDPTWLGSLVTNNMICAGGSFKGSCNGDSGGPLECLDDNNWVLAGIVSWGTQICAQITKPGVYTNVYNYVNWITQHVNQ